MDRTNPVWYSEQGYVHLAIIINPCGTPSHTGFSVFSKLAEIYLMDNLRREVALDPTQFGGCKGAGTEHLLVELVTEQMKFLDDNRAATTMISVDLEKVFNRMNHLQCLEKMAKKGASNQTIRMTASFLTAENEDQVTRTLLHTTRHARRRPSGDEVWKLFVLHGGLRTGRRANR